MSKFSHRSYELELLDAPNIPKELLAKNLREMALVNETLGGHAITLAGIQQFLADKKKRYRIVDIGCGGGDAMKQIAQWARRNHFQVELTGVDRNADAIQFMTEYCKEFPEITGIVSDYRDFLTSNTDVDIVHCSLFCHHLQDDELIELFRHIQRYARVGFVINDLHRHWLAYYSIQFLTRVLHGSVLVRNDAPLSVLKGFHRSELHDLLLKAGVKNFSIMWKWAFRYLVLGKK